MVGKAKSASRTSKGTSEHQKCWFLRHQLEVQEVWSVIVATLQPLPQIHPPYPLRRYWTSIIYWWLNDSSNWKKYPINSWATIFKLSNDLQVVSDGMTEQQLGLSPGKRRSSFTPGPVKWIPTLKLWKIIYMSQPLRSRRSLQWLFNHCWLSTLTPYISRTKWRNNALKTIAVSTCGKDKETLSIT